MNRNSILNYKKDNIFLFNSSEDNRVILTSKDIANSSINLIIEENASLNILLMQIKDEISLNLTLKKDANVILECLFDDEVKNIKILANLDENAAISGYFADFSLKNVHGIVDVNLNGIHSSANWQVASVSANDDNKKFEISLYHNAAYTMGNIDNYGVTKDDAKLLFSGVSHIVKGAKFSKTKQNAKIMVFDRYSNAIAKPILKIDENEIEASHAATVGKISDDEIFYLTSRGLTQEMAKELITLGYIKPIINKFEDEEIQSQILELIERRM